MTILKTYELSKVYGTEKKKSAKNVTKALKGANLAIQEKDFIGIMGRSGCGKTTLLRLLGGIDKESSGEIEIKGQLMNKLSANELAHIRRKEIGFIFQDYYLMDSLTTKENIVLPMVMDGADSSIIENVAKKNATMFEIEKLFDKYPTELSGGEKQRVAICRALANEPSILLADEPTGNLDSSSTDIVIKCFEMMNEKLGKAIIIATHDPYVSSFCKKVIFMNDGEIVKEINRSCDRESFLKQILQEIYNVSHG